MSRNHEISHASANNRNSSGQALALLEREGLAERTRQVEPRLLLLICVLIVVTLGMILSLLFLASAQTPSMDVLLAHLPPFHILLIGGLVVLSISAFVMRAEKSSPTLPVEEVKSLAPQLMDQQALQQPHYQAHVELLLMRIFAKVLTLPIEQVRGNSDFFLCGGDSDSLAMLLSEIERQVHIHLDPSDVFDHPVLFRLAAVLVKKQQGVNFR